MRNSYKEYRIEKSEKQKEAIKLIAANETTLLEGGGRSGKTFIVLYIMVVRCLMYPGSRHLIARFRFAHIKQAICYDTMPKILELTGMKGTVTLNKTDWFYEFENGSTIWVGGLDDKERTEKILGNEYATIFLNEASQISFDSYEMIITRLNPPKGMNAKMIIDYNPPSIQHWGYKMFHKRKFPDGRPLPGDDDYQWILMNPKDNPHIDKAYLKRLANLSEAKRRRFLDGGYSLDGGSLWKRAWIKYNDDMSDFHRIVIGVDPSGTVDGDEVGIIIMGATTMGTKEMFWVLDDFSLHGTPNEWAKAVAAAYNKWEADVVVAEKNYGGLMVESTILNAQPSVNVKLINSSRGKIVRAEPISALYEQDRVRHRVMFNDLEDEMCIYEPGSNQSPNRMDAMVFAATELSGEGFSILDVV